MARAASLDTSSVIARARRVDGAKVITLNLGPLLAPHRKHGRLSLRIERLPQQARFTRGTRNNDGSWSLATDELDDLGYQLPEAFDQAHTLAIRIINLAGGNTLAVVEHQIAPAGIEDDEPASGAAANDAQIQTLREQLAQMKTALAARESELAQARQAEQAPPAPTRDSEAEVAAARAELQADFDARLVGVGAQAATELQKHRAAWAQELASRIAAQAAEAREAAERETQEAFAKAQAAWKADEAERLAAAEAGWREASAKELAGLRAELSAAHGQNHSAELDALRVTLQREAQEALSAAQAAWTKEEAARLAKAEAEWRATSEKSDAARAGEIAALRQALAREAEKTLSEAQAEWTKGEAGRLAAAEAEWRAAAKKGETDRSGEIDALRAVLTREAADALAKAEDNWKVGEAMRLAAKESEWREESARALAVAAARTQVPPSDDTAQENQALREDMVALQAKLAARDAALVQAQSAAETLKFAAEREMKDALAKAAAAWKAEEAGRLAAAQSKWRAEAEEALTFARSETAPAGGNTVNEDARKKIGVLETLLAERDAALAEAREVIEQQMQSAQAKSQKDHKAENAARAAEAEAGWRSSYGNALAEATQRYEAAEAALAQVRQRTKDEGRLHQELASTRSALAAREKELADLRLHVAPLDGYAEGATEPVKASNEPAAKPQPFSRAFIGGVTAAACAVVVAIVFFPSIQGMMSPRPAPAVEAASVPALKDEMRLIPVVPAEKKARLTRDAKLRAEAVPGSRVVATVTKGSEVVVLEVQEKFTRVRFSGLTPVEGWVLPNALQEIPAEAK